MSIHAKQILMGEEKDVGWQFVRHYYEEIGFELSQLAQSLSPHLFLRPAIILYCAGRRVREREHKWV